MEFAEAAIKQLTPEYFFEDRQDHLFGYGSPVHDAYYKGHEGPGLEPSEFFKCLIEFACRKKAVDRTEG